MITPQLPISQPNTNIQSEIAADESLLGKENESFNIKTFLLRTFLKAEVGKNNEEQITTGVRVVDVRKNQTIFTNDQNTEHFAASVNKIPVTMLLLEELRTGRISLDTTLAWIATDRRAGAGVYDQEGSPLSATVEEILQDLLTRSGNTSVRILVNYVLGGAAAVNDRLAAVPGLEKTRLWPVDTNRFFLGGTTAKESLLIMQKVFSKNDKYSRISKQFLIDNIYTDMGVKSQLAGNDYIILVNKIGLLDDVDGNNRHDVGLVYNTRTKKTYGYSFLTTSPNTSTTATARADESLKHMGSHLLRFAGDRRHNSQDSLRAQGNYESEGRILY